MLQTQPVLQVSIQSENDWQLHIAALFQILFHPGLPMATALFVQKLSNLQFGTHLFGVAGVQIN